MGMSALDELGTAAQCVLGARQALARALEGYVGIDESVCRALTAVDSRLRDQQAKLGSLIEYRREVER